MSSSSDFSSMSSSESPPKKASIKAPNIWLSSSSDGRFSLPPLLPRGINFAMSIVNHQYSVPTIFQRISRTSIFEQSFDFPEFNYQATAWDVFVTSASVPSSKWRT